jgi:hypothetical protein
MGNDWAPFPAVVRYSSVVNTAKERASEWRYTTDAPPVDWMTRNFDDRNWKQGLGGFGAQGTPGATVRTTWNGPEIWLRRDIYLPETVGDASQLRLLVHHDEDADIYLNGVSALKAHGFTTDYVALRMHPDALKSIKPGRNTLAVHCRQTQGGQYIDVGIVRREAVPQP